MLGLIMVLTIQAVSVCAVPTPKTAAGGAALQREVFRASRLARQAEADGDFERALNLWEFVLKNKPDYLSAYYGKKRCLVNLARFDDALAFIDEMQVQAEQGRMAMNPATVAADRIEILYAAGVDTARIDREIEVTLNRFKGSERIYREISGVLSAQGLGERAVEILRRGRREMNDRYIFARDIARWGEAHMDWKTAVEEYLLYLEESGSRLEYVIGALGDLSRRPGVDSLALDAIHRKLKETPKGRQITLHRLLAALHFRAKRYDAALDQYHRIEQLTEGSGRELLEFARMLVAEGEYDISLRAFSALLDRGYTPAVQGAALLGRGRVMEALGFADSAEAAYRRVLDVGSSTSAVFEAYSRLGRISLDRRDAERARELFQAAIKVARKSKLPAGLVDDLTVKVALTWELEGELERAGDILKGLVRRLKRGESAAAARYELARLNFRRGDTEATQREADALLLAAPSSHYANECLQLKALINDFRDHPETVGILGAVDLMMFCGRDDEARAILDSLAAAGPPPVDEQALWMLFQLERRRANFDAALRALERIIDLPTALRCDQALLTAGDISAGDKREFERAAAYYEQVLVRFPDSPLADKARRRLKAVQQDIF